MSLDSAYKYLEGYEAGYLAALSDSISLYKFENIDFTTEITYLGIAVVDKGRAKMEELQQIAKDLDLDEPH